MLRLLVILRSLDDIDLEKTAFLPRIKLSLRIRTQFIEMLRSLAATYLMHFKMEIRAATSYCSRTGVQNGGLWVVMK